MDTEFPSQLGCATSASTRQSSIVDRIDRRRRSFLAARDHIGIKPLYYAVCDGVYYFASEQKCLLAHSSDILASEAFKQLVDTLRKAYDYVIIDCPPSLGDVTKNGLRISTGYVIPTIPDILSTWGIYQIVQSVHELGQSLARPVPALAAGQRAPAGDPVHPRFGVARGGYRVGGDRPAPAGVHA